MSVKHEPELDDVLLPWETLFPKQLEVFNVGNAEYAEKYHPSFPTVCLVEGPRFTGKTIAVAHRVIRHLWETPGARFAMVAKTVPSAKDAGSWLDLVDIAMPMWIEAGVANDQTGATLEYTTFDKNGTPGPIQAAKSRTVFFRIRNAHGGESEMILMSLQHDHEVKLRLKNTRFSGVWFTELSLFQDPNILRVSLEQLRMFHLKRWQTLWIGDTNPSEEGKDSWIYKRWIDRVDDPNDPLRSEEFSKAIVHVHFDLRDNLVATKSENEARRALYRDDPGELAREFEGQWVKGHGTAGLHFADLFSHAVHVIGGGPDEDGTIQTAPDTSELCTGWDLGDVNHGTGIVEKRLVVTPDKKSVYSVFCVLDSIKTIGEQVSLSTVGIEMLEKMDAIEHVAGRKFQWRHYSDDTALNLWNASSESFGYQEILIATDNKILLTGVPKPANSVVARVRLIRRLLREQRLYVAARCVDVIEMFENLKKGTTAKEYVQWEGGHKHVFDWLSYILFMECSEDLMTHRPESNSRMGDLSVRL